MGEVMGTVEDKFLERFDLPVDPDDCWEWKGWKQEHGYGAIRVKNRNEAGNFRAHVVALAIAGIRAPEGDYVAHHVCGNRGCVNPDHLEWMTRTEHTKHHQGTHCKRGHERTPENTYYRNGKPYHCKPCQQERDRQSRQRKAGWLS
jgi:hypothetical protein